MLPRGPCLNLMHPKRFTFWQKQLSNVTKTAPINVHCPDKDADFGSSAYLENIIGIARTRIFTVRPTGCSRRKEAALETVFVKANKILS